MITYIVPKQINLRNSIRHAIGMAPLQPKLIDIPHDPQRLAKIISEISEIEGEFDDLYLIDRYNDDLEYATEAFKTMRKLNTIIQQDNGKYIIHRYE